MLKHGHLTIHLSNVQLTTHVFACVDFVSYFKQIRIVQNRGESRRSSPIMLCQVQSGHFYLVNHVS